MQKHRRRKDQHPDLWDFEGPDPAEFLAEKTCEESDADGANHGGPCLVAPHGFVGVSRVGLISVLTGEISW